MCTHLDPAAIDAVRALFPDGYGLIEHLPREKVPVATAHIRRVAAECGVDIH